MRRLLEQIRTGCKTTTSQPPSWRRQEQRQGPPMTLHTGPPSGCADPLNLLFAPPTDPPHYYPKHPHVRGQAAPLQRDLFFVLTPSCCSASPNTALAGILDFFFIFLIFIYIVWLHWSQSHHTRSSIFSGVCAT